MVQDRDKGGRGGHVTGKILLQKVGVITGASATMWCWPLRLQGLKFSLQMDRTGTRSCNEGLECVSGVVLYEQCLSVVN